MFVFIFANKLFNIFIDSLSASLERVFLTECIFKTVI